MPNSRSLSDQPDRNDRLWPLTNDVTSDQRSDRSGDSDHDDIGPMRVAVIALLVVIVIFTTFGVIRIVG